MLFKKRIMPGSSGNKFIHIPSVILLIFLTQLLSCKKHDEQNNKDVDLKLVASGLVSPLSVCDPHDGSGRLFIVDQIGKIWIMDKDYNKMATPFLDVTGKMVTLNPGYDERGLLGLAFHPDFKSNGKFYVFYSAPPKSGGPEPGVNWDNTVRISEFKAMSGNPDQADISSERIVLEVNHPQGNHNGGTIAFGPDNYLYISIGDGGNKNDIGPGHVEDWYKVNKGGNGQDIYANLLGNILRIDVDRRDKSGYGIPADNPFVGKPGLDEIFAYGFRNPYRFSFDKGGSHQLFAGDAGQNLWEEVDIVKKGGDYGWNVKEGTHCFNADNEEEGRASCPIADTAGNPLIDPVIELPNADNPKGGITIAVVGGNVYRGERIEGLEGQYIFGSLSADDKMPEGKLYMADPTGPGLWAFSQLKPKSFPDNLGQWLKGFGEDSWGELYVATSDNLGPSGTTGKIYKLVPAKEDHK